MTPWPPCTSTSATRCSWSPPATARSPPSPEKAGPRTPTPAAAPSCGGTTRRSSGSRAETDCGDAVEKGRALAFWYYACYNVPIVFGALAMFALKLTQVGNSVGVLLPKEALAKLGVEKGDMLYLIDSPGGDMRLSAYS